MLSTGGFSTLRGTRRRAMRRGTIVSMTDRLNPQASQMADESMVRNLSAQARAIWPQEVDLLRRYCLPESARILDAGCGTGEITLRLAELYPCAGILGVDIIESHLDLARSRCAGFGNRVRFENRSVFDSGLPDGSFDLTVCRHLIHAIPHPDRVLAELARVTRRGGRLHLIAEDYGMIHFEPRRLDPAGFWHEAPRSFGAAMGTDLHVGRRTPSLLRRLGLKDVTVDYVVVDTTRVPRETFAAIWEAWRDGYADIIAEQTHFTREEVISQFDDMIGTLRESEGYGVWFVPVVAAVVP